MRAWQVLYRFLFQAECHHWRLRLRDHYSMLSIELHSRAVLSWHFNTRSELQPQLIGA